MTHSMTSILMKIIESLWVVVAHQLVTGFIVRDV